MTHIWPKLYYVSSMGHTKIQKMTKSMTQTWPKYDPYNDPNDLKWPKNDP